MSARTSEAMRVARVLCILALVWVHVPPWFVPLPPGTSPALYDVVFVGVQELFSRTSVPLLSAISGWLYARQRPQHGQGRMVRRKVATLLVPLILWNALDVLIDLGLGRLEPAGTLEWVNRLTALTAPPMITPLYFLRDVMLCVLLAPALLWALARGPRATLLGLAILSVGGVTGLVFLNPLLFLFFAGGCALTMGVLKRPHLPTPLVAVALLVFAAVATTMRLAWRMGELGEPGESPLTAAAHALFLLAQRGVGAIAFWTAARWLSAGSCGAALRRAEPFIFLLFCGHTIGLALLWRGLQRLGVAYGEPAYLLFYFTAPLTLLALAMTGGSMVAALAPRLLAPLVGGRVPQPIWRTA